MAAKKKSAKSAARKASKPAARKASKPAARKASKPAARKASKSATRKASKPAARKATKAPARKAAPARAVKAAPPKAAPGRLAPGMPAPPFALLDQAGKKVTLADFAGRKLVVYFYPKADTPGCTVQSCAVRDHRTGLARLGVAVVGVSPDSPAAQARFDRKYGLGFPLLADEKNVMAKAWGTWGEKSMYGRTYMGIVRSAFLVTEKGTIGAAWYGVKPDETVPSVMAALA